MWVVLRMIRGKKAALRACEFLTGEGVLSKIRAIYKNRPEEENYYELLVPAGEVDDASELLLTNGML